MSDFAQMSPQKLFEQWRKGDAAAGQAMAQRFSDWYYAVTASRLGDLQGKSPLRRACTRFEQGIVGVKRPEDLVGWAHGVLAEEIGLAGGRVPGGDFANPLTQNRSPTEILRQARTSLPDVEVRLLAHTYDSTFPMAELQAECGPLGGYPFAVLQARYRLKRVLRNEAGVAFTEVPDEPNLDYAPLPLYEAGRMATATEETAFEKWLLSNMSLCKDIAEFGVFALALRAGAFAGIAPATAPSFSSAPTVIPAAAGAPPPPSPTPPPVPTAAAPTPVAPSPAPVRAEDDPFADPPEPKGLGFGAILLILVGGLVLLGLLAAAALFGLRFLG